MGIALLESEQLVSRKALAQRWACSTETIKRRTREGLLHPVYFNARMIRYRLSEILRVEKHGTLSTASLKHPQLKTWSEPGGANAASDLRFEDGRRPSVREAANRAS